MVLSTRGARRNLPSKQSDKSIVIPTCQHSWSPVEGERGTYRCALCALLGTRRRNGVIRVLAHQPAPVKHHPHTFSSSGPGEPLAAIPDPDAWVDP